VSEPKPWYKKTKIVVGLVGAVLQAATVILTVVFVDEAEKITAILAAVTPVILGITGLIIGGHSYTDAAFQKADGARAVADAMKATGAADPTPPGLA
jgi:hypothetical protein